MEMEQVTETIETQVVGDLTESTEAPEVPVEVESGEELTTAPVESDALGEAEEKKTRYQKRIDELVREREEAKEELAQWRLEALRLAEQTAAVKEPPPKIEVDMSDLPKPMPDDFDDEDEYELAKTEWAVEKALRRQQAANRHQEERSQQKTLQQTVMEWREKGRQKYPDFDTTFTNNLPVSEAMSLAILNNEYGHDVAYALGKNPNEAYRIIQLHPIEQAMEIQKIATRESRRKQPKQESTAPTPTSPLGEREVVAKPTNLYDPNISFKEYERIRNKQKFGDTWGRT